MKMRKQHCGVVLVLVVIVTTFVGGLLTLLAANASQFHRRRQADSVREVSLVIADSAASYALAQRAAWSKSPPEQPIELDIQKLLPARMTGTATLTFTSQDNQRVCHISAQAEWGACSAVREADIPLIGSTSQPTR